MSFTTDGGAFGPATIRAGSVGIKKAMANVMTETTNRVKNNQVTLRTAYDAIFSVKNGGVGYGKISPRVSTKLKAQLALIQKQIVSGKIVVRRQSPPATTG